MKKDERIEVNKHHELTDNQKEILAELVPDSLEYNLKRYDFI